MRVHETEGARPPQVAASDVAPAADGRQPDAGPSRRPVRPQASAKRSRRTAHAPTHETKAALRIFVALIALFPILMIEIAPAVGGAIPAGVLIGLFYATALALTHRSDARRPL